MLVLHKGCNINSFVNKSCVTAMIMLCEQTNVNALAATLCVMNICKWNIFTMLGVGKIAAIHWHWVLHYFTLCKRYITCCTWLVYSCYWSYFTCWVVFLKFFMNPLHVIGSALFQIVLHKMHIEFGCFPLDPSGIDVNTRWLCFSCSRVDWIESWPTAHDGLVVNEMHLQFLCEYAILIGAGHA